MSDNGNMPKPPKPPIHHGDDTKESSSPEAKEVNGNGSSGNLSGGQA